MEWKRISESFPESNDLQILYWDSVGLDYHLVYTQNWKIYSNAQSCNWDIKKCSYIGDTCNCAYNIKSDDLWAYIPNRPELV